MDKGFFKRGLYGTGLPGDFSGNNEVDFVDYSIFASYWLDYCPDDWHLKTIVP